MITRGNAQFPPKVNRWLTERKTRIELFLGLLVTSGLLAYGYNVNGAPQIIMLSMTTLAIFYFLSSYLFPDIDGKFGAITCKVLNISSAVCVLGLMFSILKIEGAEQMIFIGTTSVAISGLILAYFALTSGMGKLTPLFLRILIFGVVFGILRFG